MTCKSNRYSGLLGGRIYRSKYQDCQYSQHRGSTIRLLTEKEIEEFRMRMEEIIARRLPRSIPL